MSVRIPGDLSPTAWARARAARGAVPHDLTISNPTVCGIPYPPSLLEPLSKPASLRYRPDPKGLRSAREAVAREYAGRGVTVDPERIILTASSSESYGFLFKALCDPGEAVLVPTPSYPLFDHLASLEGVRALPFPLDPDGGWQPLLPDDPTANGARALILVHPNNPTGSWVDPGLDVALPLIVDEVFFDFPLGRHEHARTFAARDASLTFSLGGLSKSRGLPQLKLSWIVASGPVADVDRTMGALEFIADSYLSVGTPVQEALPEILDRAAPVRDAIRTRCAENVAHARDLVARTPTVELLEPGGGWSAVLRFPRVVDEDALVLDLLERHGVAVHPGYFFDFPSEGYLVISLLPDPPSFKTGLELVLEAIASRI